MSRYLIVGLLIIFSINSSAQNGGIIKHYVYEQAISGGAVAVDENGEPRFRQSKEYLIYVETPKGYAPIISSVYINGLSYSGRAIKSLSPVMIGGNMNFKAEVIVGKTTNQVWQILIERDEAILKPTTAFAKIVEGNAFVMKGSFKGKSFVISSTAMKELRPLIVE